MSRIPVVTLAAFLVAAPAVADVKLSAAGNSEIVYDSQRDACEPIDVPDINMRAFRDADGNVISFMLHYVNRALRGPDLGHLKIECHVALGSHHDPDPAHFDDRNYIAALWTENGRDVSALVHHEYHADNHKRCVVEGDLGCWYNSILAFRSTNGGFDFAKQSPAVVAAAPFKQDVEQGRHRGFFNPSNIFADGRYRYFFGSTTGWTGQSYGNCLFRTSDPSDSSSWRAYDGRDFTVRFGDPYGPNPPHPKPCAAIAPFTFAVGAVVRERRSGQWIAVFQAARNDTYFPVDGFYYATAADLLHWSAPKLLVAGQTLYSDLCKAGNSIIAYPSLLDENAKGRNFDDVGAEAYLYYALINVDHCATGQRLLVREKITIDIGRDARR